MELFDRYNETRNELFEYFGYVEDHVVLPFEDNREYYWWLDGEGHGDYVFYAETEEDLRNEENYYSSEIYTQRFLPKWVYRGEEYTLIVTNPHIDGNRFLSIFSNEKEIQ